MGNTEVLKDEGRSPTKGAASSSNRISDIQKMKAAKLAELKAKNVKETKVDNREGSFRKPTGKLIGHICYAVHFKPQQYAKW